MHQNSDEYLKSVIRFYPDFPKPGIQFVDLMPILYDRVAFQHTVQSIADLVWQQQAEALVAVESRGFLFGAPAAFSLGIPLVPVRKKGKLPGKTDSVSFSLEYGEDILQVQHETPLEGKKVVLFDDLLATGGTAAASIRLIEGRGAQVVSTLFLVELLELKGASQLGKTVHSLVKL